MFKYGVQISQQGVPLERAADYQKVLDSNWKFLDILEEIPIDFTTPAFSGSNGYRQFKLYEHGLGFLAAYEFIPSSLSGGNTSVSPRGKFDIMDDLASDDKAIYYVPFYLSSDPSTPVRVKGMLRVYTINMMEEYTAPSYSLASTTPTEVARYGAKFIDFNRGNARIDDASVYPFTLNTRAKQISIHKCGSQSVLNDVLTIDHKVGYPPTYLLARINDDATWSNNPFGVGVKTTGTLLSTGIRSKATNNDIVFRGQQNVLAGTFGYIILKDPAEIAG